MFDIAGTKDRLLSNNHNNNSYVKRGITQYAVEILDKFDSLPKADDYKEPTNWQEMEAALLLGAKSWKEYSYSGRSLCNQREIMERTCPPWSWSKNGSSFRTKNQNWYDKQAWALELAMKNIKDAGIQRKEVWL